MYKLLYDNNKTLCFVGNTVYNNLLYNHWKNIRPCVLITVEQAESNGQAWIDQHQFMCAVSNVGFKRFVVDKLSQYNPSYFSVVGDNNEFKDINIGVGTFIQHYNTAVFSDATVGNHCTLSSYITLSHHATVCDFCHVSGYCFINYTTIQPGNLLAIRCSLLGSPDNIIDIAPNCNFMVGSTVTKSVNITGTYFGNRLVTKESSLTYKLL